MLNTKVFLFSGCHLADSVIQWFCFRAQPWQVLFSVSVSSLMYSLKVVSFDLEGNLATEDYMNQLGVVFKENVNWKVFSLSGCLTDGFKRIN